MTSNNNTAIRVAINGAAGRMGRNLIRACAATDGVILGAALEHGNSEFIGSDAGLLAGLAANNIIVGCDLPALIDDFDVLIDFTRPEPALAALQLCAAYSKPMVIGTTGFSEAQKQSLQSASAKLPIVLAANYSVGVNVLFKLLSVATRALGAGVDIEISETHHRHKVDAPSGTALAMGEAIAKAMHAELKDLAVYERHGVTGERKAGTIGFATTRAGDVVGDHTALFADIGERIEISHKASDRIIFANGALRAAKWLALQNCGLYDMQDVLNLKEV